MVAPVTPPPGKDIAKPVLTKVETDVDKKGVSVTVTPNENCTLEGSGSISLTAKTSSSGKKRVTKIKLIPQKKAAVAGKPQAPPHGEDVADYHQVEPQELAERIRGL